MLTEIKDGQLYYYGYNLTDLAKKYGTPLKITFLDLIKDRVTTLKNSFDKAIKANKYGAKFVYLNANKANYSKEEILESFKYNDGIETSSYYDLLLTYKLFGLYPKYDSKKIVCNGVKGKDYLDLIIKIYLDDYHIIDVIDNIEEYEYLKSQNLDIKVGLRVHLQSLYCEEGEIENDRFGLTDEEFDYILNDIKNTKLRLTTIHYHQRGMDYEDNKFLENFEKAFKYYAKASKLYKHVKNFDIGGGTPLPYKEDFDYDKWADKVVKVVSKLTDSYGCRLPNIFSENGRYTVKDSIVNIYKVVCKKNTDKYPWHIIDGSLMIAIPEVFALGENIDVTPINDLDKPFIKGKLAGLTCDCDDVLFDKEKGYIELPDSNDLYIACLGTGSYQNSMNGKGGIHHCLLPEEKDVVISKKETYVRHNLQSIRDVYRLLKL